MASSLAPSPRGARAFWEFCRPHTIVGTSLSVLAMAVIALKLTPAGAGAAGWPPSTLALWLLAAWIPSLGANVFIVGLNQLTDIAIDRINKPHLPLASGAFSVATGRWIVGLSGLVAVLGGAREGPILLITLLLGMAVGTSYSLPPLRLKRFPFWAALCIVSVRGLVANIGFFDHFRQRLSQTSGWSVFRQPIPAEVWALTAFVVIFSIAIALLKDVPDATGDRQHRITTFTLRWGAAAVLSRSRWVLTVAYGLMIALALGDSLSGLNQTFFLASNLLALALLWWRSRTVDIQVKGSTTRFYQFIWKLFFLEYLLLPIACLLA